MMILKYLIKFINDFLFGISMIFLSIGILLNLNFKSLSYKDYEMIFCSIFFIIFGLTAINGLAKKSKKKLINEFNSDYKQDIFIFKIIKKYKFIFFIFLITIFVISFFDIFEYKNKVVFSHMIFKSNYFLYYFVIIFINFLIYIFGFLIIGEFFQRKFGNPKRLFFIDLLIDFILSIPFTLILSFLYLIFLMTPKKTDNFIKLFTKTTLYGIYLTFKYFTYLNLAIISYEDKWIYKSFIESKEFCQQNSKELIKIYLNSGLIFLSLILFGFSFILINIKFKIFFILDFLIIYGLFIFIYVLFCLFSEQIMVLVLYLNKKGIKNIKFNFN